MSTESFFQMAFHAAIVIYIVLITILIIRSSRSHKRKDAMIDRMNEQVIAHRRLVNELQAIGEDEAGILIELERRRGHDNVV